MPGFNIVSTNHTSFTVSNLERTLAFFSEALGFEVTSKGPRSPDAIQRITGVEGGDVVIAYVRGPGHSIELIEYLGPADRGRVESRPCDVGFAHLAYDVDDIEAAVAASAPHGFHPIGEVFVIDRGPNAGGKVVYTRDADGVTIEFIEKAR